MLAADTLIAASGDFSPMRLAAYETAMVARFGPRETATFTDRLPEGLKRFLATRMLGNRWFTRHMVIDEWFLHARQPALTS
jgi:hypothetical protein